MENLLLFAHVLIALLIIGLIMLQQGKGAEAGASFGSGASQTVFGSSGSGNFFSKMTAVFALLFFVTSFSLAVIAKQSAQVEEALPELIETQVDEVPEVEDSSASSEDLPEVQDDQSATADVEEVPEVPAE